MHWVILIGGGYGAYMFEGTREEAELARAGKSSWEGAVGLLRHADIEEIHADRAKNCFNHLNFKHMKKGILYGCDCGECDG